ncbi:PepSY-associated TM helix domain-containing protein [Psychrobacillus vulpis]|uniref:PepSY domain-containing protein n=1 Tax=Psychrobacillus vulpis TaxID=2325572 RepID=A0A544TWD0_9BACI|nr:PepSY domain-containing protein [Psychrobacillus vulpis]TQR21749.1 PepSY domain-containing protein [Psychrobacillus vulpis]
MKNKKHFYNIFWRWHFYAGIFIAPLLITLTISGIGYLFYTNVENQLYDNLFFGDSNKSESVSIDEAIENAENEYDGYSVTKVIVLKDDYNTRLTMTNTEGNQKYVFIDDHNQIVGSQNAASTYSNVMRGLHSSLFVGGTVVNYLVELAACWAIFLLISGVYMSFKGKVFKRQKGTKNKRQGHKKLHAITGTLIAIPMVVLIFTGLPWSALMGNFIYSAAQSHPSIGIPELQQVPPTSENNEIPWATRKNEPPASTDAHAQHNGMSNKTDNSNMISVQNLIQKVEEAEISKPYSIVYPISDDGVYTVSKGSNTGVTGLDVSPYEEMTTYFDQYSGKLISKVGYEEYGILGKWFTWGIPLHEGHLFGWPNKIINLIVCLAFLAVIFWGYKMWLDRKVKGQVSAPPKTPMGKGFTGFIIILVMLGIVMPLFGISLIVIAFIEFIIYLIKNKNRGIKEHNLIK